LVWTQAASYGIKVLLVNSSLFKCTRHTEEEAAAAVKLRRRRRRRMKQGQREPQVRSVAAPQLSVKKRKRRSEGVGCRVR
jgi:hypothetical protein